MKQATESLFKEIDRLHSQNWDNAQRTAENAILIGIKFHQIKEQLPHGEFEEAARKATKVSDCTRARYMRIAEERLIEQRAIKLLQEDNAHGGQKYHVTLLEDRELQAIPVEARDLARDEVRADSFSWTSSDIKPKDMVHGLEGKDIGDLYRDYKIIRDKKPKQHVAPRKLTPAEMIAAENALHEAALIDIENSIAHGLNLLATMSKCQPTKRLKQHLRAVVCWTKAIRPLTKRKLSPAEKKADRKTILNDAAKKRWKQLRSGLPLKSEISDLKSTSALTPPAVS